MDSRSAGSSAAPIPAFEFVEAVMGLELASVKGQAEAPTRLSHDPEMNKKSGDPFQFGNRFLTEEDDVFEHNAWDHVETDDDFKEYAEQQYEMQRQSPVSDFDKGE
jgi:tRNAThr (cytosine32-N3)-methyltransferase